MRTICSNVSGVCALVKSNCVYLLQKIEKKGVDKKVLRSINFNENTVVRFNGRYADPEKLKDGKKFDLHRLLGQAIHYIEENLHKS